MNIPVHEHTHGHSCHCKQTVSKPDVRVLRCFTRLAENSQKEMNFPSGMMHTHTHKCSLKGSHPRPAPVMVHSGLCASRHALGRVLESRRELCLSAGAPGAHLDALVLTCWFMGRSGWFLTPVVILSSIKDSGGSQQEGRAGSQGCVR